MAEKKIRTGAVIVTDLGGLGKKIFHSGDKVTEKNFPPDNFDRLVKGGYIKEDEYPEEPTASEPQSPSSEFQDAPEKNSSDEGAPEKKDPLDDVDFGGGGKRRNRNKR